MLIRDWIAESIRQVTGFTLVRSRLCAASQQTSLVTVRDTPTPNPPPQRRMFGVALHRKVRSIRGCWLDSLLIFGQLLESRLVTVRFVMAVQKIPFAIPHDHDDCARLFTIRDSSATTSHTCFEPRLHVAHVRRSPHNVDSPLC